MLASLSGLVAGSDTFRDKRISPVEALPEKGNERVGSRRVTALSTWTAPGAMRG